MSHSKGFKTGRQSIWSLLFSVPRAAAEAFGGLTAAWIASSELRRYPKDLAWNEGAARSITCLLDKTAEGCQRERAGQTMRFDPLLRDSTAENNLGQLPAQDHLLIQRIHEAVTEANKSNITRTRAYLEFYEDYPEIHWALLAHMVSRNAGWNMSDLQSGLMSDLTDNRFKSHLYRFLERCNALIFQDAYPQLLLYKFSKQKEQSYFHLLPYFHVSAFMSPFWERFWIDRNSSLLTVALIINEQNYIENRVVRHPYFRKNVLDAPSFQLHELARLNQIIFPLGDTRCRHDLFKQSILPLRPLVGLTMKHFDDPSTRIKAGKSLYAMLFGYEDIYRGVFKYVHCSPHLGSRSEYWPALFTTQRNKTMNSLVESKELLQSEWLTNGHQLYSPLLEDVWHDTEYEPIPRFDWFQEPTMLRHLSKPIRPFLVDMTHAHRTALERTAFAHDLSGHLNP
ncbi:Protein of unknown function [Paenibacillus uliginis N3/975]|uniref:DUF2515 domain-containing protein n=1 Tax=Paenibacillus uliginis N3/975 TaxID=1313296 RepID=A0A1X7GM45_9BACL|nr:DUF2515 family protein [Paenibacillus uliginis]SMF71660.1 Protein of unknown function [Paenibacillus uliginis N3/975]